ncbi:MAG: translation initiation factor IF-2 [Desulfobulbaceae bacterium]|jgi:translation initiation factor IF-2|nr:translation initiation factor IF-2 [Desulfobulbaceae bacterium]MDH3781184.1 translation initiation factor IF-2 [Desulfobulbaceae bacterium]HKJ14377.1 translation initiation factor IF-2 [Desulfobulbales bacterium]
MSKIRVYDLAKEAGMTSKELAEKLIDLGYTIKSHSSTVDAEVADEIRRNVLGTVETEVVEKRISTKGRATIIRRRAQTVRREPEPPPPAEEEGEPSAEAEEEIEKKAAKPARKKVSKAKKEDVAAEAAVAEEALEQAPSLTAPEEPEAVHEPEAEKSAAEVELQKKAGEQEVFEAEEKEEEKPKPKEIKRIVPPRKGLAKVIKKAAIQVPEEKPKVVARPAKGKARVAPRQKAPDLKGAVVGPGEEARAAKGKKKGKRLVQFRSEVEERGERLKKGFGGKRKDRRGFGADGDYEYGPRGLRGPKGRKKKVEQAPPPAETRAIKKRIKVFETISVGDLSHKMSVKVNQVIAKLMGLGVMATVNQILDIDTATLVAADFGYEVEQGLTDEINVMQMEEQEQEVGGEALPRPPVVTVMGHVDHGKTSILDSIRKTDVALGEAGGITQHIGAYYVRSSEGDVVFLDTPGHAAFTEMRSRGAQVTDVVVLVVAADDGVKDQTKEAINHAQAAQVPIVVAINKIDKPDADPKRVKRELSELGLMAEDWGGEVIFCETSAKKGIGIEELLKNILLQAEILELKANPTRKARGRVIEAQLHKGRGPVATVLVQEGTLHLGEPIVIGQHSGKVRTLINDKGEQIEKAGPATPVEIQGLSGVPQAGDEFMVVRDEKMAKNVSAARQLKARELELGSTTKISLDKLFEQVKLGDVKELRIVLRSDVQGTLEAFRKSMEELSTDMIKVRILHEGTGTITESDVLLASASEAIIIGFNVRPSVKVKDLAGKEHVDIRFYDVIYHALDDIKKAMVGLLEPEFEEAVIGSAEVRETFQVPKIGTIAGCYVIDGKVTRNAKVRVLRDGVVIYTGQMGSLKRFKDDAREVASGYECGIGIDNFNDIKVGDVIEAFIMEEVEASL